MLTLQEIERTLAKEANLKRLAALAAVSIPPRCEIGRLVGKVVTVFGLKALKIKHVGKLFFWS